MKLDAETIDKLSSMAEAGLNVLLTGSHGIGKTTMFEQLCSRLGMNGSYINVPAADFFVDWLGIPSPAEDPETIRLVHWFLDRGGESLAAHYLQTQWNLTPDIAQQTVAFIGGQDGRRSLEFLRPKRLDGVEWILFDEINREADPRFVDACMELVQFRTINGEPVPSLKLVWACQNPPNSIYRVRALDTPLIDKFGAHVYLEGNPNQKWYESRGYDSRTVADVLTWYRSDLNNSQREQISPRCLENVMRLVDRGFRPGEMLLESMQIPSHLLEARLARLPQSHKYTSVDLATIQAEPTKWMKTAEADKDFCAYYVDLVRRKGVAVHAILRTLAVFLSMPFEYQNSCLTDDQWRDRIRESLKSPTLPDEIKTIPGFPSFDELVQQYAAT